MWEWCGYSLNSKDMETLQHKSTWEVFTPKCCDSCGWTVWGNWHRNASQEILDRFAAYNRTNTRKVVENLGFTTRECGLRSFFLLAVEPVFSRRMLKSKESFFFKWHFNIHIFYYLSIPFLFHSIYVLKLKKNVIKKRDQNRNFQKTTRNWNYSFFWKIKKKTLAKQKFQFAIWLRNLWQVS